MSPLRVPAGSLRTQRMRALAPRLLVYVTLAILCAVGLRAVLAGPPTPVVHTDPGAGKRADLAVLSFAESFAHAYLTWDADDPDTRAAALAPYLGDADRDGGIRPAEGTTQTVAWASVAAVSGSPRRTLVTVAAQTSHGMAHLVVPVSRSARGVLRIAGYPALVGPPAVDREHALARGDRDGDVVDDAALIAVAERTLVNYLAGDEANLLADLSGDAVVSLPDRAMRADDVGTPTWVVPGRRVATRVAARDPDGTELTLRYELEVVRSDRWYVRSIHVNPTSSGGTP